MVPQYSAHRTQGRSTAWYQWQSTGKKLLQVWFDPGLQQQLQHICPSSAGVGLPVAALGLSWPWALQAGPGKNGRFLEWGSQRIQAPTQNAQSSREHVVVRGVNHSQGTCQKSCSLTHSRGASGECCTNLQRLELCHISGWNSHGFAPVHQEAEKDVNRGLVTTRDQPLLLPSGTACCLPLRRMLSTVLPLGITHFRWSLPS